MTKTLDTLIPDIYETLEQGVDVTQPHVAEALEEVGGLVREAVETILREGQRKGASHLRLSSIGKPDRQIWYGVQGEEEKVQEEAERARTNDGVQGDEEKVQEEAKN